MAFEAITRKFRKIERILKEEGLSKGLQHLKYLLLVNLFEDSWLVGKVVEMRGNLGRLDGATFHLDSPYISTSLKSRFPLASWELEARYLTRKYLPGDQPVIELGSCLGVVSCLTNKILASPELHVVVEANRNLIPLLEKNRAANDCRFKIINAAIAYGAGDITFYLSTKFNEGHVGEATAESITVPTITLQDILKREGYTRANLVCDIEGSEIELLAIEGGILSGAIEWVVIEMHGPEKTARAHQYLESLGFDLVEQVNHNRAYRNRRMIDTGVRPAAERSSAVGTAYPPPP